MSLDLEAFAATVAHELRAPLRAAYAHATLAAQDPAHLEGMQEALRRVDRVVERTYAFARSSAPSRIDLAGLLSEAVPEARIDGPLPFLYAPEAHVHAAVVEPVRNALEHAGDATVDAPAGGLRVIDHGARPLPEDPFELLPPRLHGRGGGLALARRVLDEAGGSIHLDRAGGRTVCAIGLPPVWSHAAALRVPA